MHLYEISGEIRKAIEEHVDQETGEISDEAAAALTSLEMDFREKSESIGCIIRERIAEGEAISIEADRLAKRARAAKNDADRLKSYLLDQMVAAGLRKIKGTRVSLAVARAGTPRCECADLTAVSAAFIKTEVTQKLDRAAVLEEAKTTGITPRGVTITYTDYLRVT